MGSKAALEKLLSGETMGGGGGGAIAIVLLDSQGNEGLAASVLAMRLGLGAEDTGACSFGVWALDGGSNGVVDGRPKALKRIFVVVGGPLGRALKPPSARVRLLSRADTDDELAIGPADGVGAVVVESLSGRRGRMSGSDGSLGCQSHVARSVASATIGF